jgi:DNA-directed RNA polymerase specialized sigma24 family protein
VRRIVRDERMAEEVTEDVFFQVWRQADRFDSARGRPLGWILTIARTRALDSLRRADPAVPHPDPDLLDNRWSPVP